MCKIAAYRHRANGDGVRGQISLGHTLKDLTVKQVGLCIPDLHLLSPKKAFSSTRLSCPEGQVPMKHGGLQLNVAAVPQAPLCILLCFQ